MSSGDWCEAKTPEGKPYYFNKKTKATQWTKPAELGGETKVVDPKDSTNPEYWRHTQDKKTGKSYYYNKVTKEVSWKKPECMKDPNEDTEKKEEAVTSSKSEEEPKKNPKDVWKEATDQKSGRRYWYNKGTGQSTWKNPHENADENKQDKPAAAASEKAEEPEKAASAADDEVSEVDKKMEEMGMNDREAQQARMMQLNDDEDEEDSGSRFKFAKHRKGWFNRTFRVGEIIDDSQLLTFKSSLIKKALLKLNRDLDAEAIQCFKNVMSYMGDRKSSKVGLDHAKKMLRNLMQAPATLRDEVYMQLCKQTTNNPRTQSTIKGWELMLFCIASFPPSKHLKSFLQDFLNKTVEANPHENITNLAKKCLDWLPQILHMGQRKQVPSKLELECLMKLKNVPITIYLCNKVPYNLTVNSYTLVSEVEQQMMEKLNLTCTAPFGLFEQAEVNEERLLQSKMRILDVMASWENREHQEEVVQQKKKEGRAGTTYDKHKDMNKKVSIKVPEYTKFLFKAKLVLKTNNKAIMSDSEAVHLLYIQAVSDVVTARYPTQEKDMTVLAALQLQSLHGDYNESKHQQGWLENSITEYIPQHLVCDRKGQLQQRLVQEWETNILAKYAKVAEFTSLDAKLNYLDYVQEKVHYGATMFTVEQRQFKDYPSPLILGINSEGVLLMDPENKNVLENYAFTDIVTWGSSDEKFIVVVGNIVQQRKLIFKTLQGSEMHMLIHDYVRFKVKFSN